jgi:hypothetical protein
MKIKMNSLNNLNIIEMAGCYILKILCEKIEDLFTVMKEKITP